MIISREATGRIRGVEEPMTVPDYQLRPASEADFEFLFHLHEASMKSHVELTWGWDDSDQERRFRDRFDPARCRIVVQAGRDVGMIEFEDRGDRLWLNVIEIRPGRRGGGGGARGGGGRRGRAAAGRPGGRRGGK